MIVKIKKSSELNQWSMYCLEDIFGYSSGHGCGMGGEDIEFQINKSKKLVMIQNYHELEIKYVSYDDEYNEQKHPLTSLPVKWQNKLLRCLKEHTYTKKIK